MIRFKHLVYMLVALTWFEKTMVMGHRLIILYGLFLGGLWLLLNSKKIFTREISFTKNQFYLITALLFFWGWLTLSLAWADQITWVSKERIFNVIAAVGFTVILLDQFREKKDWINAYKILAVVGVISSFIVLQETFSVALHSPVGYISPDINYTAMRVTILFPLLYYWAKTSRNSVKLPLLAGILIAILATVSTGSRAGIMTLIIIASVVFFYELKGKSLKSVFPTFLALLVISMIIASIIPGPLTGGFERFESLVDIAKGDRTPDINVAFRYAYLVGGVQLLRDNPLLGVGVGNFQLQIPNYIEVPPNEAHNTYLAVAGELGVIGIIIFLGLIVFTLKNFKALEKTGAKNQHDAFIIGAKIAFISVLINFLFLTAFTDRRFYLFMAFAVSMLGEETISLKEFMASLKKRVLRL